MKTYEVSNQHTSVRIIRGPICSFPHLGGLGLSILNWAGMLSLCTATNPPRTSTSTTAAPAVTRPAATSRLAREGEKAHAW